jgi:hypothetical protein
MMSAPESAGEWRSSAVMCAAGSSYARTLRGTCLKRFAASDILSDITLEKSATVGKRKKADEKTTIRELAESARLGEGSRSAACGRKTIPGTPCLPATFRLDQDHRMNVHFLRESPRRVTFSRDIQRASADRLVPLRASGLLFS